MHRSLATLIFVTAIIISSGATPTASAATSGISQDGLWQDLGSGPAPSRAAGAAVDESRRFNLDLASLESAISRAPIEGEERSPGATVTLTIPMPDGSFPTFVIEESPVMEPELAAALPNVRTFRGSAVDDPTIRARFDRTQLGFHAMVLTPAGAVFVRPVAVGVTAEYESYWSSRYEGLSFECGVIDGEFVSGESLVLALPTGETLYQYRLAVAGTGEYTQFFGNVDDALANIVTIVNQLNLVYEVEAAVRMVLVGDNADIVYDDPDTDPFPLANKNAEVQDAIDDVIGDANYDIGHLFHVEGTGISGDAGCIGCVCTSGSKGSAWSQGPDPTDGDYLFVVSHEMGHQYGATHTFNGSNCNSGQYTASSSWEPGSGSTIMSYSSICGADNVLGGQVGDLYFHVGSRDQITTYTQVGGGSCATTSNTGNTAPSVDAGQDWTIPQGTPFRLTATGSDGDGDALTYTWEQFDQTDDSAPLNAVDDGLIPLFRSYPPASSAVRIFPAYDDLLAGLSNLFPNKLGEQLPSTDRTLTFRTSARDGRVSGGGTADDQMIITVSGDPFSITFPNGGETVGAGAPLVVAWTVGGGSVAATVNILYATDGGTTWSTLASGVANDGSHQVVLPCGDTSQGRIMIEAVGHIFFDISDLTFTVADMTPPVVTCPSDIEVECSVTDGVPIDDPQLTDFFAAFMAEDNCDDDLDFINDAPALFPGPCEPGDGMTVVTWTATDDAGNSASCAATVTVVDTTPPEIMVTVEPEVLWPPNHKMVEVEYTVTVSDICDDDPQWVLVDVVSDEPDNGSGDGDTDNDIQDADLGTPDNLVSLRSERSGRWDGRVYTATFEVTDCSGNSSDTTCNVYVPHSASDFVTIVATGAMPGTSPGAAFMISGASLFEDEIPAEMNGDYAGEINFLEPVSAFITNTAGLVHPNAFFIKDVDFDEFGDVLVGFDVNELAELIAISTPEDGDPDMVLEIGHEHFIVIDLDRVQDTDLDLRGMIDELLNQTTLGDQVVQNDPEPVRDAALIGAAPNPFNPSTKISYYIPDSRHVELAIFDISGRRIARLVSQTVSAGEHSVMWHGKDDSGGPVASGVYFYQLTAGQLVETKRMILIK